MDHESANDVCWFDDYLLDTGEGRVRGDVRRSTSQQMACTFACVVQFVPYIAEYHTVRFSWGNLLPELCINKLTF